MDIFQILKNDHKQVKSVLKKMIDTQTSQGDERKNLIHVLKEELIPHMAAEEQYFYNTLLKESKETEDDVKVYEAIEEHKAARYVLSSLENTTYDDPRWEARALVLKELIEHHIEEEEEEVFRIAHKIMDSQRAESVGDHFNRIKEEELSSII
jgi:hemerythrin-like domain-containing protein